MTFWLLAALILRLLNVAALDPLYSDEPAYDTIARNLLSGEGFREGGAYAYRYPGYVGFLAAVYSASGDSRVAVTVIQAVLGTVTVLFLALIVRGRMGDTAALFSAAAMSIYVPFVRLPGRLYTENLFFLLLVLIWWLMEQPGHKLRWRNALVAGVLAGLAVLTREVFLAISVLYVILRLLADKEGRRDNAFPLLGYLIVMCVIVAPWTARNYQLFGRFVPVTTNGWTNIYMGNNPEATGRYPTEGEPPGIWKPPPGVTWTGEYIEISQMDYQKQEVFRFWREHPGQALKLAGTKLLLLFAPPFMLDVTLTSTKAQVAGGIWSGMFIVLLGLTVYGLFRGAPSFRENLWAYTLLVTPLFIGVVTYVIARYRFPMELALIYFAANGYIALLSRYRPGLEAATD